MEPGERKKRVLIALAGAALALAFMGNFFWSFFKDFFHEQSGGGHASKTPLLIFGGFFLVMVVAVVLTVVLGIRKAFKESSAAAPPRDPQPWLKRADWAAGKIKSTATVPAKIMLLFALVFGGFGGFITFSVLPKELHNGKYPALFVLLFPAVGIGCLIALVRRMLAQRRFGDCFFELASLPAPIGGTLEGQILVGTRLQLEHGLHLTISCVRRTVSGSGDNRNVSETVLWQDEKIFRPEAGLPEPEPGRSGIPVFFKLPANQPECFAHGNEAILWRLAAKTKMSGPDFSALFEVPVFKVAGAVAAETEATETDPTAALQMPVEELRRDENSKIQITDGPDGRTFYFPAARNPGTAASLTVFFLIWSGFLWFMIVRGAPLLFPIVFGIIDVLLIFGCINLWFKSSRVIIDSSGVTAVKRWVLFSRKRRFEAGEIVKIIAKTGMTSGTQAFQDIKLVTRANAENFEARKARFQQGGGRPSAKFSIGDPSGFTLASSIRSAAEAQWLIQEMTKVLGRKS